MTDTATTATTTTHAATVYYSHCQTWKKTWQTGQYSVKQFLLLFAITTILSAEQANAIEYVSHMLCAISRVTESMTMICEPLLIVSSVLHQKLNIYITCKISTLIMYQHQCSTMMQGPQGTAMIQEPYIDAHYPYIILHEKHNI